MIYHDLSSIHIYSWNWPPKKCATLILVQKSHRHFPYVPQVLCTEEGRLEPGALGDSPTANCPNPASGWKSGLQLWRKGCHFDPKKHPSRKQLKSCIRGPKHQRTIYYEISDLISQKKTLPWSFSPDVFLIHADLPMGGSHWLLMHQWNVMWNVAARTMEAEKQWAWDVQSGQPANPDFETCFVVTHASPIATKTRKNIRGIADFKHLFDSMFVHILLSFAALSYKITKRSSISDQVRNHWQTTIGLIFDHEEPLQRARASENQDTFNISNISFCIHRKISICSKKHSWSLSCSRDLASQNCQQNIATSSQKRKRSCLDVCPILLGSQLGKQNCWRSSETPLPSSFAIPRTLSGMFTECLFMTLSQNYQQYLHTHQV